MKVLARTALAIVGGYIGTSATIAALALATVTLAGMDRSEAATLGSLLGFLIYLGVMIWSFSEPRLSRLALKLGAVTTASVALFALLSRLSS
jgi:hypothetical protein